LEVHKLIDGKYQLMPSVTLLQENSKVIWMPEIGLGIGCERSINADWDREWLYWYDRDNVRYLSAEERADQERQQKQKLANYLRSLGINPDEI
jgi:aminoglycoside phosphotransferase